MTKQAKYQDKKCCSEGKHPDKKLKNKNAIQPTDVFNETFILSLTLIGCLRQREKSARLLISVINNWVQPRLQFSLYWLQAFNSLRRFSRIKSGSDLRRVAGIRVELGTSIRLGAYFIIFVIVGAQPANPYTPVNNRLSPNRGQPFIGGRCHRNYISSKAIQLMPV